MDVTLAEVMRIAATAAGTAFGGPGGGALANLGVGALTGLANALDHEDDPETPASLRRMKQKRRESWLKEAVALEKEKREHLKKFGESDPLKRALNNRAAADLRAIILGSILETENRIAGDQEVNIFAEAVSAAARRKL